MRRLTQTKQKGKRKIQKEKEMKQMGYHNRLVLNES